MTELEQSIPLSEYENVPADLENMSDTSEVSEPEMVLAADTDVEDEADVSEKLDENNGLIFGKFKTMEDAYKGYKEAERSITKAAELEKELQLLRNQAVKYEENAIARENGYADRYAMALEHDVLEHEIKDYALAASRLLKPEQQLEIRKHIDKCMMNPSKESISKLRNYFPSEIVALVSGDSAVFKGFRKAEYEDMRSQDRQINFERKLKDFYQSNKAWETSSLKKEILSQALEATDGDIDLLQLKEFVDQIADEAVKSYQKQAQIRDENAKAQESLSGLLTPAPFSKGKKWLTKEDYYKLTPQEERDKYNLILEQIDLEKRGLLPRSLT